MNPISLNRKERIQFPSLHTSRPTINSKRSAQKLTPLNTKSFKYLQGPPSTRQRTFLNNSHSYLHGNSRVISHKHSLSMPGSNTVQYPISPAYASNKMSEFLTPFQLQQIRDYKQIYFLAPSAEKIKFDNRAFNLGFDNSKGDYKIIIGDHLAYRYEIQSLVGRGSFGQVCKCRDHKTNRQVAVKIIKNKKRYIQQSKVEVKVLKILQKADLTRSKLIIEILDSFMFRNHPCIVFQLLSINLYQQLKVSQFQGFSLNIVKKISVQLLKGLEYMKANSIIHCDMKLQNVLLVQPRRSLIKIIDFGSSCLQHQKIYTYIQSRFYRAPQIILGVSYSASIDMWSFGCILAQLYTGFPIFPGEDQQEQLLRIMEAIGVPPTHFLQRCKRKKLFFDGQDKPRIIHNSRGRVRMPGQRPIEQLFPYQEEEFVDLLKKIFVWEPEKRLTPETGLLHPWLNDGI